MKKLIFVFVFVLSCFASHAQDLIVTSAGDSVNCKIKQFKNQCIYFSFKQNNEVRNTLIQISSVVSYKYNYYKNSEIPEETAIENKIYSHFKLAITAGFGYRIASVADNLPSAYQDYLDDSRGGPHIDVDLIYFFKEKYGIGLKYSYFNVRNNADNLSLPGGGYGDVIDNIKLKFIGPIFSLRKLNATKRNALYMNFMIGYLGYKDDGMLDSNSVTLNGSTAGLGYDIGYDIGLSKNSSIAFQISYLTGTLTQYEMKMGSQTQTIKLEKENYENFGRLDFSAGFRLNW